MASEKCRALAKAWNAWGASGLDGCNYQRIAVHTAATNNSRAANTAICGVRAAAVAVLGSCDEAACNVEAAECKTHGTAGGARNAAEVASCVPQEQTNRALARQGRGAFEHVLEVGVGARAACMEASSRICEARGSVAHQACSQG